MYIYIYITLYIYTYTCHHSSWGPQDSHGPWPAPGSCAASAAWTVASGSPGSPGHREFLWALGGLLWFYHVFSGLVGMKYRVSMVLYGFIWFYRDEILGWNIGMKYWDEILGWYWDDIGILMYIPSGYVKIANWKITIYRGTTHYTWQFSMAIQRLC